MTLADLENTIGELRATIIQSGPRRFTKPNLANRLINFLQANMDEILEDITETGLREMTGLLPTLHSRAGGSGVVLLYLLASDWDILEETLRMDCESKNVDPELRLRIQSAFDAIQIVRGIEISFEAIAQAALETKTEDALRRVHFLPVRIGKEEVAVAVVSARVTPELFDQSRFLDQLKRAVIDWTRTTEAGRSLRERTRDDLNIGDLASHGIDAELGRLLSERGIHDLHLDEWSSPYPHQAWGYDTRLLDEDYVEEGSADDLNLDDLYGQHRHKVYLLDTGLLPEENEGEGSPDDQPFEPEVDCR